MRRGRLLQVKVGSDILSFKLTGSNRMLSRLLNCARRYKRQALFAPPGSSSSSGTQTGNAENPFAKNPTQEKAKSNPQSHPTYQQEARNWYKAYLASANEDYVLLPKTQKNAKLYKKYALVWRIGKSSRIYGTMRIFPKSAPAKLDNTIL